MRSSLGFPCATSSGAISDRISSSDTERMATSILSSSNLTPIRAGEELRVLAPVRPDLDERLEEHLAADQRLDVPARQRADFLEPRSAGADQDRLLPRPLH